MKKIYFKPTMQVVTLQHQHHLLAGSRPNSIKSNLYDEDEEDEMYIDDEEEAGSDFWGR